MDGSTSYYKRGPPGTGTVYLIVRLRPSVHTASPPQKLSPEGGHQSFTSGAATFPAAELEDSDSPTLRPYETPTRLRATENTEIQAPPIMASAVLPTSLSPPLPEFTQIQNIQYKSKVHMLIQARKFIVAMFRELLHGDTITDAQIQQSIMTGFEIEVCRIPADAFNRRT